MENVANRNRKKDLTFGKLLCSLMERKGMTIREGSSIAGVGPSTIQSWRVGSRPEDMKALKKLAHALGVSMAFLLTGEEDILPEASKEMQQVGFISAGILFEGFAKIKIEKIIPRTNKENSD
jgi:transcriptional regulator with XRE-family HTH domain